MIKIKNIKPMFTSIVTTMDKYENDTMLNGIIDPTKQQGVVKEYQRVLAIGDTVRSVKPGDLVCINPARYAVKKHREGSLKDGIITDNPVVTFNFNVIELDGEQRLLLQDSDISYIITDYEEVPDTPAIIKPEKKKIVV